MGPDFGGVECGVVFIAHRQDVAESLAVTLDFQEGLLVGAERLFAIDCRSGIVLRDLISLDAVGALDGTGQRRSPQTSLPAPRRSQDVPQVLAPLVYFIQDSVV